MKHKKDLGKWVRVCQHCGQKIHGPVIFSGGFHFHDNDVCQNSFIENQQNMLQVIPQTKENDNGL